MTLPLSAVPWALAAAAQPEPRGAGDNELRESSERAILDYVKNTMYPAWQAERNRLRVIDLWLKGEQANPNVPRGATKELQNLLALSKTPWLGLVVTTIAQTLYMDGYRSRDSRTNVPGPWKTWNANGFPVRQIPVHRAAIGYGYAYVKVLPGKAPGGEPRSVMRGASPKRMYAVYDDPGADDWPEYAIDVKPQIGYSKVLFYDDVHEHELRVRDDKWEYVGTREHGAGVCPIVRYTNQLDLEGSTPGEVEPFISVASRIDKTEFDRLMTQHFNSWKVRTIAGMASFADSEEEAAAKKLKLRQQDFLVSEDADTKFGTLDETNLGGFISAHDSDVETLAAVTQLPSHLLTGKLVNLSADALAAARASVTQKAYERKIGLGASHAQSLRLSAKLEGDYEAAEDVFARVIWQDVEVRSLAQAVDALGKAATMLGIPKQALWSMLPGVTAADVEEWSEHALDEDPLTVWLRTMSDPTAVREPAPAGHSDLTAGL